MNIFTACRQLLVMAGGLRASDAPIKSRAWESCHVRCVSPDSSEPAVIFSSYVSTDEVQPRIGLDTDTTLHKLWEDAHAWRQEHNVVHSSRHRGEISAAPAVASPRHGPAESPLATEQGDADDEDKAPRGASVGVGGKKEIASKGAGAAPLANELVRGAGGATVDVGRPAEQSTEMFRSLRSVAMQLDQVNTLSLYLFVRVCRRWPCCWTFRVDV